MDEVFDRIFEIWRTGIPIQMVEQNPGQAIEIADKSYFLVQLTHAYSGTGRDLFAHADVNKSLLGG